MGSKSEHTVHRYHELLRGQSKLGSFGFKMKPRDFKADSPTSDVVICQESMTPPPLSFNFDGPLVVPSKWPLDNNLVQEGASQLHMRASHAQNSTRARRQPVLPSLSKMSGHVGTTDSIFGTSPTFETAPSSVYGSKHHCWSTAETAPSSIYGGEDHQVSTAEAAPAFTTPSSVYSSDDHRGSTAETAPSFTMPSSVYSSKDHRGSTAKTAPSFTTPSSVYSSEDHRGSTAETAPLFTMPSSVYSSKDHRGSTAETAPSFTMPSSVYSSEDHQGSTAETAVDSTIIQYELVVLCSETYFS